MLGILRDLFGQKFQDVALVDFIPGSRMVAFYIHKFFQELAHAQGVLCG